MTNTTFVTRLRLSIISFVIAGIFFVLYPAIRPFSDEASLQGAEAFASSNWLIAHVLAMVAFTSLPIGLLGFHSTLSETPSEKLGFTAIVLSMIGVGLTLPFYGGETFGLHAIGQEALKLQNTDLIKLAVIVRSGIGLNMFIFGLLLLVVAATLSAIASWKSGKYPKWSGVPLAMGFLLYLPQFFWSQPLRVAHGFLVAIGCFWLALELWKQSKQ